jgi:DNA-directed RNA polymerase alpha subunit
MSDAPATEFPKSIGKVAARELALNGFTRFAQLAKVSRESLLAIHGVGPKSVNILEDELKKRGLAFRSSKAGKRGSPPG